MRLRLRLVCCCAVVALATTFAPAASAAPPAPFGHACAPLDGALSCPAADDAARVPSFDGVPIDVDVWLPPTGDGPFPTIAMLHGFGQSKTAFEAPGADPSYNASAFARAGYAVVVPTARGFGRSCGAPDSRTVGCERGWTHVGDQRYEARDVQWLLGLLVDQGVARPDALGVTGISYGGGTSLQLAMLGDRVRLPDGATAPWSSPAGTPLAIAAAWPRWPWSDLADALVPNGRLGPRTYASPIGVELQAYTGLLSALGSTGGFLAPPGVDPGADITSWAQRLDRGEPYGTDVTAALDELHAFHGALNIPIEKPTTPLLIQAGWTDDLFPVGQTLRIYDLLRGVDRQAPVALQLGDLGHARGANHPDDVRAFDAQGLAFLDQRLSGAVQPAAANAAPGTVTALRQTCPRTAPSGGPAIVASSFAGLARGSLVFRHRAAQRVTSSGGDAALSQKLSPLALDPCKPFPVDIARGTAIASVRSRGFTLLGRTRVRADVAVRGRDALVVGRLWDVDPAHGRQRLVDRGVVRLRSKRTLSFALNGNAYRFAPGHLVQLELVGRDAPTYRAANDDFSVTARNLTVTLPTRERRAGR